MISHNNVVLCSDIVVAKSGDEALKLFKKANPIPIANYSSMCKCYQAINYRE